MYKVTCNWLRRHNQPSHLASNVGRYPRRSSLPDHEMFSFYHHDRSVSVFGSQIFDGNEEDEFSLSYMNEEVSENMQSFIQATYVEVIVSSFCIS